MTELLAFIAVAASVGTAALIVASEPAFTALKLAGAAYLVGLGAATLLAAVRGHAAAHEPAPGADRHELRQSLLSNLGNPRMRCSSPACCRSSGSRSRRCSASGSRSARSRSRG